MAQLLRGLSEEQDGYLVTRGKAPEITKWQRLKGTPGERLVQPIHLPTGAGPACSSAARNHAQTWFIHTRSPLGEMPHPLQVTVAKSKSI